MNKLTPIFLGLVLMTVLTTSCNKNNQDNVLSTRKNTTVSTKRMSNEEYLNAKKKAACIHNSYLEYIYDQYSSETLGYDTTDADFFATLTAANAFFASSDIAIIDSNSDWRDVANFLKGIRYSNQSVISYCFDYANSHSSTNMQNYTNRIMGLVNTQDLDFIKKSDSLMNEAIADSHLTDAELDGIIYSICVAQGSFSYWQDSTNVEKWTELTGTPPAAKWGQFWGADAMGAAAGACAGALFAGIGAGPGAVCIGAICSGAVALDW
jgi:hypothetical protein